MTTMSAKLGGWSLELDFLLMENRVKVDRRECWFKIKYDIFVLHMFLWPLPDYHYIVKSFSHIMLNG